VKVSALICGAFLTCVSSTTVRSVAAAAIVDHVRGLPEQALAALPPTVTSAILVDKAAQLRVTDGGRNLWELLSSCGLTEAVEASWPALASDLGLAPDQAVDELLGKRLIVATGDPSSRPHSSWVLATHVTAPVEKMLRERLRPAARSLVKGFPILAIGHGEFELATALAGGDDTGEKLAVVILSPAGNPLFDDVLEAIGPARASTETIGSLAMPESMQRVDAMLLLREPRGERETVLIATVERRSIELSCVSDGSVATLPASLPGAVLGTLGGQASIAALAAAWGGTSGPALQHTTEPTLLQDLFWAMVPLESSHRARFGNGAALCVVPGRSVMWAASLTAPGEPAAAADEAARLVTSSWDRAGSAFHGEAPSAVRVFEGPTNVNGKFAAMVEPGSELAWIADRDSRGESWWIASCGERVLQSGPGRDGDVVLSLVAHPARMSVLFKGSGAVETIMDTLAKRVESVKFQMKLVKDKPGRCAGGGRIDFAQ